MSTHAPCQTGLPTHTHTHTHEQHAQIRTQSVEKQAHEHGLMHARVSNTLMCDDNMLNFLSLAVIIEEATGGTEGEKKKAHIFLFASLL